MRLETPELHEDGVRLASTGVEILCGPRGLRVFARIPQSRPLMEILGDFSCDPSAVEVGGHDLIAETSSARITLGAESRITLESRSTLHLQKSGEFEPRHRVVRHGTRDPMGRKALLLADEFGGFLALASRIESVESPVADANSVLEVQVFPPRHARAEHLGLRIAHEGRPSPFPDATLPTSSLVETIAPHADLVALHAYFWREEDPRRRPRFSRYWFRRCPWLNARFEPVEPERLTSLIAQLHDLGKRVVPYFSPHYCATAQPLHEMERLLDQWAFDGFYFDRLRGDLDEQLAFMRAARSLVGPERFLYLNASAGPFDDPALITPAIDSWADVVLRGDSGRGGLSRDVFLREAVSGWNRSGAIGLWCHYGSRGWPLPFESMPSNADIDAALAAHVRLWRRSIWSRDGHRLDRFDDRYEPGLTRLANAERASVVRTD